MATMGSSAVTLSEYRKRFDPDHKIARVIDMIAQSNPVLDDMTWMEGNLPIGHQVTVQTAYPDVFWRIINQPTPVSKDGTAQFIETCGKLSAWSEVDEELANLNGDVNAFRASRAKPFVSAMNKEFAQTLFYGNSGLNPEEITGLSARYSSTAADNGRNILLAGGAGADNASIWLVGWGANGVSGIYPKGSQAGLRHDDYGLTTITGSATASANAIAGSRMRVYQEQWRWNCGLALFDWQQVARIANIDVSNLVGKSSAADLTDLMIKATHVIRDIQDGRFVFYMPRTVLMMLDIQRRDDVSDGGGLTYDNVDGKRVYAFRDIPVKPLDSLLVTEALVA